MREILKPGDIMIDSGFLRLLPDFDKRCRSFRRRVNMHDVSEFIAHIRSRNYVPYIQSIITDDGDPVSVGGLPAYIIDDDLLEDLPKRQQKEVLKWIKDNISPRKTPNKVYHTYRLKHVLQWDIGIYLTENQFKDAMLKSGYYPVDVYESSWTFPIGFNNVQKVNFLEQRGRYIP